MTFKIGTIPLANPFVLAPMVGATDLAFRLLCKEYGAGLCYSEMVNSRSLVEHPLECQDLLKTTDSDQPVAIQLYGSNPQIMAEAAVILNELPIDIIDLNMGCPMEKITALGAGAALMKNCKQAGKIMAAVCRKSKKPVTIKIRSGWDQYHITAPEIACMAQDAGVQAIAIHARTRCDGFSGQLDLDLVRLLKESVSIPIIANGDIKTHDQGLRMLAETGCDAVMIGRAALGAPWIFSARVNPEPSMNFRVKALLRHFELIDLYSRDEEHLVGKVRNHSWKYFRGTNYLKSIRNQIAAATSYREQQSIIQGLNERFC
jgi:nifR3 family TIM-barrel protein